MASNNANPKLRKIKRAATSSTHNMSKRRRRFDQEKSQEPGTRGRQLSQLEKMSTDLSRLVQGFGEHDPRQQPVSRGWRGGTTKYCEMKTRSGETCLQKGELTPSCVRYCMGPAPCAVWVARLLGAMQEVARATFVGDKEIAVVPGTASLVLHYAVEFVTTKVNYDGEHWGLDSRPDLMPEGSLRADESLGQGHWRIRLSPTSEASVVETGPPQTLSNTGYWRMDAANAARIICYLTTIRVTRTFSLSFELRNPTRAFLSSGDLVSFRDRTGNRVQVTGREDNWGIEINQWHTKLSTNLELRDAHSLWCEQVTHGGEWCIAEENRVRPGCADYCLSTGRACQRWTFELLRNLGAVMYNKAYVTLGGGGGADQVVEIEPQWLNVDLLDQDGRTLLHARYRDDKWSVATSTPGVEAWSEKVRKALVDDSSAVAIGRHMVFAGTEFSSQHDAASRLICYALQDGSVQTLRAEIVYEISATATREQVRALRQLDRVPGSNVLFKCAPNPDYPSVARYCPPVELAHEWQITPRLLSIEIRIR